MAKLVESALTPGERIMLLNDVWASVRTNREPIGDYLVLAEGMQADRNSAVIGDILDKLSYIGDRVVSADDRESYNLWVRQLLAPIAQDVGWEPKPGEDEDRARLRAELMSALGEVAGDSQANALALQLANKYLTDPFSVDHALALASMRVAARAGDEILYDKILADLKAAKTPEAYYADIFALSGFSDPKLVDNTLEYAISSSIRSQDAPYLISRVMQYPPADRQAWSFVQAHWTNIEKLGGAFAGGTIVQATGSFCDPGMRDEVKAFFSSHPTPSAERTLRQSVEQMNYCVDLKAQQAHQLGSWLRQRNISAAE